MAIVTISLSTEGKPKTVSEIRKELARLLSRLNDLPVLRTNRELRPWPVATRCRHAVRISGPNDLRGASRKSSERIITSRVRYGTGP